MISKGMKLPSGPTTPEREIRRRYADEYGVKAESDGGVYTSSEDGSIRKLSIRTMSSEVSEDASQASAETSSDELSLVENNRDEIAPAENKSEYMASVENNAEELALAENNTDEAASDKKKSEEIASDKNNNVESSEESSDEVCFENFNKSFFVVAEELPFAAVALDPFTACSHCFSNKYRNKELSLLRCKNCHTIRYCSKECQKEDWKFHQYECKFIIRLKADQISCPPPEVRIMSRMLMRYKKQGVPVAFNGRKFHDLTSYEDPYIRDDYLTIYDLSCTLSYFMGTHTPSAKDIHSFYLKYMANGVVIRDGIGPCDFVAVGLYIGLSVHEHSCRPSCEQTFIGPKAVLRAKEPNTEYSRNMTVNYSGLIQPKRSCQCTPAKPCVIFPSLRGMEGQHCKCDDVPEPKFIQRLRDPCAVYCNYPTQVYYGHLLPKKTRRDTMRFNYTFDCQCERCTDEEEDLLERSGRSFCCPDGAVLPIDNGQPLVCNKCQKESSLTLEQINGANKKLQIFWSECRVKLFPNITCVDVYVYKDLFRKMKLILSPYNLHLVSLAVWLHAASIEIGEDKALSMEFLKFQEKAMKRYAPFGLSQVRYNRYLYEAKNEPLTTIVSSKPEDDLNGLYELYNSSYIWCGRDHPYTKLVGKKLQLCDSDPEL